MTFQGDVFFQQDPLTTLFAIAAYGQANQYTWARGGYKRQVTNTDFRGPRSLSLGAELTAQGNEEMRVYQAGPMFEIALPRSATSLQFRAGYSSIDYRDGTTEHSPYFGAGFYRRF